VNPDSNLPCNLSDNGLNGNDIRNTNDKDKDNGDNDDGDDDGDGDAVDSPTVDAYIDLAKMACKYSLD
jgi:hypothetical protein